MGAIAEGYMLLNWNGIEMDNRRRSIDTIPSKFQTTSGSVLTYGLQASSGLDAKGCKELGCQKDLKYFVS